MIVSHKHDFHVLLLLVRVHLVALRWSAKVVLCIRQSSYLDLLVALLPGDLWRLLVREAAGSDRVSDTLRSIHDLTVTVLVGTLV